jgi:hypothetical protein
MTFKIVKIALPVLVLVLFFCLVFQSSSLPKPQSLAQLDTSRNAVALSTDNEIRNQVLEVIFVIPGGSCPEHCFHVFDLIPDSIQISFSSATLTDLRSRSRLNNALLVCRGLQAQSLAQILKQWKRNDSGRNIGIFVMADENNKHGNSRYAADFSYALRNYYFDSLNGFEEYKLKALGNLTCGFDPKQSVIQTSSSFARLGMFWVLPLKNPILPSILASNLLVTSSRRWHCCFIGSSRNDRRKMINVFRKAMKRHSELRFQLIIESKFFGSKGAWEYGINSLSQCMIALLPVGNSPETIRFSDSISLGSIPLIKDSSSFETHSYLTKFFAPPPILRVDSWEEGTRVVASLIKTPDVLNEMQRELMNWYQKHIACQKADMKEILSRAE